jgi:hypothetical protein
MGEEFGRVGSRTGNLLFPLSIILLELYEQLVNTPNKGAISPSFITFRGMMPLFLFAQKLFFVEIFVALNLNN